MTWVFEQLETRQLLAASVVQKGGTLTVSAGATDDAIRVDGSGRPDGSVEVFADTNGDGNVDASLGIFNGVQNLVIKDKGGNNAIGVDDVIITGNLSITTGKGDDCVYFWQSTVGGKVTIKTGSGDDLVVLLTNLVTGGVNINTGSGAEIVEIAASQIGGKLNVNLGGGNDTFAYSGTTVASGSKVNGAGGSDLFVDNATPNPVNLSLQGFEDQQSAYPNEVFNQLVVLSNSCVSRMGGLGVFIDL